MAEKTLQEALGTGATQDSTTITLLKSELGITATVATADQVIAAINIKAKPVLTEEQYNSEIQQRVYLTDGYSSFTNRSDNTSYRVDQIVVNLAKPDTGATFSPNDY